MVAEWDGGSSGDSFIRVDVASELGSVSLVSVAFNSSTANGGAGAHDTSVDATRDTVNLLDIDLGQVELLGGIGRVFLDICFDTDDLSPIF